MGFEAYTKVPEIRSVFIASSPPDGKKRQNAPRRAAKASGRLSATGPRLLLGGGLVIHLKRRLPGVGVDVDGNQLF